MIKQMFFKIRTYWQNSRHIYLKIFIQMFLVFIVLTAFLILPIYWN
jgi:hypothetical protein